MLSCGRTNAVFNEQLALEQNKCSSQGLASQNLIQSNQHIIQQLYVLPSQRESERSDPLNKAMCVSEARVESHRAALLASDSEQRQIDAPPKRIESTEQVDVASSVCSMDELEVGEGFDPLDYFQPYFFRANDIQKVGRKCDLCRRCPCSFQ